MAQNISPSTTGAADRPSRPRLFYVDHLRVVLTVLVVLHHAAITYGNIPVWYLTEPAQDPSGVALDLFVLFNQTFFMGMFFLIAGYFVPGSIDRRSVGPMGHCARQVDRRPDRCNQEPDRDRRAGPRSVRGVDPYGPAVRAETRS